MSGTVITHEQLERAHEAADRTEPAPVGGGSGHPLRLELGEGTFTICDPGRADGGRLELDDSRLPEVVSLLADVTDAHHHRERFDAEQSRRADDLAEASRREDARRRQLAAHLIVRHGLHPSSGVLDDLDGLLDAHAHEHTGPGTIRSHRVTDLFYDRGTLADRLADAFVDPDL